MTDKNINKIEFYNALREFLHYWFSDTVNDETLIHLSCVIQDYLKSHKIL